MDLIYHYGLNCRLAAIVNIASELGVNYLEAYSALWSEIDFKDETEYGIFVSRRIYNSFEALGLTIELQNCENLKKQGNLPQIEVGEFFVVGADIFGIPWHTLYKHFHERHFYFARKDSVTSARCFDPIYEKKDILLNNSDILIPAFEICRIRKREVNPTKFGLEHEAREILYNYPKATEGILADIESCKTEGKTKINTILKQITAMINNRHLFAEYIRFAKVPEKIKAFFDKTYLQKWESTKYGLNKAKVLKNNHSVLDEVKNLISRLMHEDAEIAKKIIDLG